MWRSIKEFLRDFFTFFFPEEGSIMRLASDSAVRQSLTRSADNPIITPTHYTWESAGSFNPAALYIGGRVHLLYRAMGHGGQSVLGYASSKDGIVFDERLPYPVYTNKHDFKHPPRDVAPEELRQYRPGIFASGGGWTGCEDPRAVVLDDRIYVTYTAFAGWDSVRVALTSISVDDFLAKKWHWQRPVYLSPHDEVHKNWVMFPEKLQNAFAFLHNIYSHDGKRISIDLIDNFDTFNPEVTRFKSMDPHAMPSVPIAWHTRTRSAGPPPLKTRAGWLVLYHAHSVDELHLYKLGAMLLDLKDPTMVRHRAQEPILSPEEWYENDWKPGVIYVSGAIIKDDTLYIYYGAGDKHVAVATANLDVFLNDLTQNKRPHLLIKKTQTT